MTQNLESNEKPIEIETKAQKNKSKKLKKTTVENLSTIELHSGEELSDELAYLITARNQTKIIVLAGDSESGKTTLLSSVYEKFLRGPIEDFMFAGSQTLMGFERRSWRSRISSNATEPDTDRTLSGEQNLLHLYLFEKNAKDNKFQDMLLVDISGEDYREARISHDACLRLEKLKRADHFALLIDGEKILNNLLRHEALRNSKQLLQRLLDSKMLPPNPLVNILVTKYDKILPHLEKPAINEFLQKAESDFRDKFAKTTGALEFYRIASRPKPPSQLTLGYGFEQFFPKWVKNTPFNTSLPSISDNFDVKIEREFDMYLKRQLNSRNSYE